MRRVPIEILLRSSGSDRQVILHRHFTLIKAATQPPRSHRFRWGHSPKDEALRFNHPEVADLIQQHIDAKIREQTAKEEKEKLAEKDGKEELNKDTPRPKIHDQGSIGSI